MRQVARTRARVSALKGPGLAYPALVQRFASDALRASFETGGGRGGRGGYEGARRDRAATERWRARQGSADADLIPDLAELRNRSRDLYRNSPIARGAILTNVRKIVGWGLEPRPQIDAGAVRLTPDQAAEVEAGFLRVWSAWSRSTDCDVRRSVTFAEQQGIALHAALEGGDCFALKRHLDRGPGRVGFALQLVEGDRVDDPSPLPTLPEGSTLAAGVECDRDGAPVAYHVASRHPGDLYRLGAPLPLTWQAVPAFDGSRRMVLHLFRPFRPDQTRGEPYLAPVIEPIKQLARYAEAEIMAAVIGAMFTVFIKQEGGPAASALKSALGRPPEQAEQMELGNGAILDLGVNESVEIANPGRPNAGFDPFVLAILRQIGVALELPFEVLVAHFTASYSAARAALLEAWGAFRARRSWLASRHCQPAYDEVIAEGVALGLCSAPGFLASPTARHAYLAARWDGPVMGQLSPLDEQRAAEGWIAMGVKTLDETTAEVTGGDWERNARQRRRELDVRQGLDAPALAPGSPPVPPPGSPPVPPPGGTSRPADGPDQPDRPDGPDEPDKA